MLLEMCSMTKCFGGIMAVKNVSFGVEEGKITALIGPNGAGKTTIFNLISGTYRPDEGEIILDGKAITGMKPYLTARAGITRTFQNLQLFGSMTVLENVMTGAYLQGKKGFVQSFFSYSGRSKEEKQVRTESMKLLEVIGLAESAHILASGLPFGQQRLLEIARCLALHPRLILLDEPAAGLNAAESEVLTAFLKKLRRQGVTMVMIEHDMQTVMEAADKIVVLNFGEIITEGSPAEIQAHPEVIKAYLGEDEQIA